jgi:hypothetical protein
MLAFLELLLLRFMTTGTRLGRRKLDSPNILDGHVLITMAFGASHAFRAVLAQLPIRDDIGGYRSMTLEAILCRSSGDKEETHHESNRYFDFV